MQTEMPKEKLKEIIQAVTEAPPEKSKEQLEKERREMEAAQRKLEAETIKNNRDLCARVIGMLDEETIKIFPSLDLVPGEAFLKGAVYAMGAIVHRAVEVVEKTARQERREMETQCAKDMGKVLAPLNAQRASFSSQKEREIDALRKEKQVKIMEAQTQIAMAYNEKIKQVDERQMPEEIQNLTAQRNQFEADYQAKKDTHEQAERTLVGKLKLLVKTAADELTAAKK